MKGVAWLALLLVVPATATEPGVPPPVDVGFNTPGEGQAGVTWNVLDDQIRVGLPGYGTPGRTPAAAIDVYVAIGLEGEPNPREWYVLHAGNASYVAAHDGSVDDQPFPSLGADHWTVTRVPSEGGDCIVVAARTWVRIDDQQRILDRAPPGVDIADAWGDGHNCHVEAGTQPGAAKVERKEAPAGWLVPIAAIAVVLAARRI